MVKPVEINVTDAAKRYRAGESLRKIALALGCSQEHVRKNLKAAGVEMRERKRPRTRNVVTLISVRLDPESTEELAEMVSANGKSQSEVVQDCIRLGYKQFAKPAKTRGKSRS